MKSIKIKMVVGDRKINSFMEAMDLASEKHKYITDVLKFNVQLKTRQSPKKFFEGFVQEAQNHFFVLYAWADKPCLKYIDRHFK